MGFNQHSRGTDINRLCHGMHLLSGHFGRPGDAPTSLTGQPSACGTVREVRHALPSAPRRAPGGQRRASRRFREILERARRSHQSQARISHRADVGEVLHAHEQGGDVTTLLVAGHQPRAVAAEPAQAFQSQDGGSRTSSSSCPTCIPRRRPNWPTSFCPRHVGRKERHVWQLGAPHAAVVQDGRAAGRRAGRLLADHRGRAQTVSSWATPA
jgi:hypothetical protein